jgi:hypothetical protein
MPYLCYINHRTCDVPYFQVLPECSRAGALQFASRLLREHDDGESVDLWRGEHLMARISRHGIIQSDSSSAQEDL